VQCAEQLRVQAYFDGEVDAVGAVEIERHLEHCAECRAWLESETALRGSLRALPQERAPQALRARIAQALDAQAPLRGPARAAAPWRTRPFWLGAGSGLAAALAAGLAVLMLSPTPAVAPVDALVAAHVRSLMPEHLTDVVSTDRHTVKPWFAGHADVSPVVADFSAQGYRLVGGRADYFDGQRAAAVVYQHGAHLINVFTWRPGVRRLPHASTVSGYHVLCWRAADLAYCAVSDSGWDELNALQRLLQELSARDTASAPE
jgi:anti-sigma factor (TIGR02949 family)